MGKVYKNKTCDICHKAGIKVIETWGIKYCRPCWNAKPKSGNGHSGMVALDEFRYQQDLFVIEELSLEKVPKSNPYFATLFFSHYPQSKGIVGRSINYLVKRGNEILGIIGGSSPPLNYKIFNAYFGDNYSETNWLNNNVFRLINNERNLGTKVLRLFREAVKLEYQSKFNDTLIGLVTFVEPPRTGAVYKADNWQYLGVTQGKKVTIRDTHKTWVNNKWTEGTKKLIYGYKYKE